MTGMRIQIIKKNGKDGKFIANVIQNVVPRKGEILWFCCGDEANSGKVLKKFGTREFKVVKVCHWMTENLSNNDRVMVYVRPINVEKVKDV